MSAAAAGISRRQPWTPIRGLRRLPARVLGFRAWYRALPRGTRSYLWLVFIIAFAGFNTENNLVYMVGGLMIALVVLSAVLARASVDGLRMVRTLPPHLFAGEPVTLSVALTNTKRRLGTFAVTVQDSIDGRPTHEGFLLALPPGETRSTQYTHTFDRRGRHTFDALAVDSAFPFGFFPRRVTFSAPQPVVVYPHIDPVDPLVVATLADPHRFAHLARGQGANIYGIRQYRLEDDARHICWKLSAKSNQLLMREFETEQATEATIILDTGVPDLAPERVARLEAAVRLTASLAWALVDEHLTVRLIMRTGRGPAASGQQHLYRILYELALAEPMVGEEHRLPPLRVHDVNLATCAVILSDPTASWVVGSRFPVVLSPDPAPAASRAAEVAA